MLPFPTGLSVEVIMVLGFVHVWNLKLFLVIVAVEYLFGSFEVFGSVNADRFHIRQPHLYAVSVLQPAQLLKAFGHL